MNPYPVEELAVRDLVAVEVQMTRFKLKKPGDDRKPSNWVDWRAQFELHAISLFAKSKHIIEEEKSEVYI